MLFGERHPLLFPLPSRHSLLAGYTGGMAVGYKGGGEAALCKELKFERTYRG